MFSSYFATESMTTIQSSLGWTIDRLLRRKALRDQLRTLCAHDPCTVSFAKTALRNLSTSIVPRKHVGWMFLGIFADHHQLLWLYSLCLLCSPSRGWGTQADNRNHGFFQDGPSNSTDIASVSINRNRPSLVNALSGSTTRIGVKRIVIEVNRDLTVEQLEIIDNALRQVGLIKATKVTLHATAPRVHKPRPAKPTTHHDFRMGHGPVPGQVSNH